jgi:predicted Fe-S protein YdhL (DUF1289 family)
MTPSPCIQVCVLDPVTGFCIGCGRTGDEIAAWPSASEAEKAAILAPLAGRLSAMTSRAVRGGRRARPTA